MCVYVCMCVCVCVCVYDLRIEELYDIAALDSVLASLGIAVTKHV